MSKKYYIALDDYERGTIINCLNEKRNNLIADGKFTDAVDEVLLKVINAKQKRFNINNIFVNKKYIRCNKSVSQIYKKRLVICGFLQKITIC